MSQWYCNRYPTVLDIDTTQKIFTKGYCRNVNARKNKLIKKQRLKGKKKH